MVLGYNQQRPNEENYRDFLNKIIAGFRKIDGLSLMIFGSYVRKDHVPGRSDIDGVVVFPGDVVIDKKDLGLASIILRDALDGNHIPFQVTVTDLETMKEGRFNSFKPDFEPYFEDEGKILVGPDYRKQFTYRMPEHPEEIPLVFNLRKARQGLFFSEYDRAYDYERFLSKFNSSLDVVSRGSKQILFMKDGRLRKNRFSALEEIPKIFPDIDVEPLIRIKHLYHNLPELDKLYFQPDEMMRLWNSSVTFFEEMIRAYMEKVPHPKV